MRKVKIKKKAITISIKKKYCKFNYQIHLLYFGFFLIISFIQLSFSLLHPFNISIWENYPSISSLINFSCRILRFISEDSQLNSYFYNFYSFLILFTILIFLINFFLIRFKKNGYIMISILYYLIYGLFPIINYSITMILTYQIKLYFLNISNISLFNFIFSIFIFLLFLIILFISSFSISSCANPNFSNPLSIWAPFTNRYILNYYYLFFIFIFFQFTNKISLNSLKYFLIFESFIYLLLFLYYIRFPLVISHNVYCFCGGFFLCYFLSTFFLIFVTFFPNFFKTNLILIIWLILPIFSLIYIFYFENKKKNQRNFKLKKIEKEVDSLNFLKYYNLINEENYNDFSNKFEINDTYEIISLLYIAFLNNSIIFKNSSFLPALMKLFPDGYFEFLHLIFLSSKEIQIFQSLCSQFLSNNSPSFLQTSIIFQMYNFLQEVNIENHPKFSNDLIDLNIESLKCSQLRSKFWYSCIIGDINQMSRKAFLLQTLIFKTCQKWEELHFRYPLSPKVLQEYIKFLSNEAGEQIKSHYYEESFEKNEINYPNETEFNIGGLIESVEEAVNRRKLISFSRFSEFLILSISFSIIFVSFSFILTLFLFDNFSQITFNIYNINDLSIILSQIMNQYFENNINNSNSIFKLNSKLIISKFDLILESFPKKLQHLNISIKGTIDYYNFSKEIDFISSFRLLSYFIFSLSYTPYNDNNTILVFQNIFDSIFKGKTCNIRDSYYEALLLIYWI